jgi:glycosyltransferase involved in cell wall biosynthesis
MKALVIAPQPFVTHRGTPLSVYYRLQVMAELGEQLDLLTYGEGLEADIPGVRILRVPRLKFLGNVKTGPSMLKLLLDIFIFFRAVALLVRNDYDYVHAHEEAVFIARVLKPLFRFRLIYDMHSSLPEQLVNFSFMRSKLLIRIFSVLERSALHAADAVIVICPSLQDYAERILGTSDKIILIENSLYEPIRFEPGQELPSTLGTDEFSESTGRDGRRSIVYAGGLYPYQGIDMLLESFRMLCDLHDDVDLLILGGTPEQVESYSKHTRTLGVAKRCRLTGRVTQEYVNRCNELATMVVSPRQLGTNTPLKIYALLASGVPLVATRIESHTQVLTDDVAVLVAPNVRDFSRGMGWVLDSPEEAQKIAINAQRRYTKDYSRPAYVKKIQHLLGLLDRPPWVAQ